MNTKSVRRGLAMMAVLAVTGAGGFAVASSASAAGYGGVQPENTICFKDRKVVRQAPLLKGRLNLGKIELWYSPRCRTTWARVETVKTAAFGFRGAAEVIRNTDQMNNDCWVHDGAKACTTTMMNDANVTSYARGWIFASYPSDHSTHTQTGSY